jgi:hypothetical protein
VNIENWKTLRKAIVENIKVDLIDQCAEPEEKIKNRLITQKLRTKRKLLDLLNKWE